MRAMYRYQVPIGEPAEVDLTGDPVAVAVLPMCAGLEFWAEHDDEAQARPRTFTVAGTGHPLPHQAAYVGTAPRTPEGLVFHLYELLPGLAP